MHFRSDRTGAPAWRPLSNGEHRMNRGKLIPSVIAAIVLATGIAAAQAQSDLTLANAGTLTCTAKDTPKESKADAELSCAFKAPSGEDSNFTGFIARSGNA